MWPQELKSGRVTVTCAQEALVAASPRVMHVDGMLPWLTPLPPLGGSQKTLKELPNAKIQEVRLGP
jgi:hypothetical protein